MKRFFVPVTLFLSISIVAIIFLSVAKTQNMVVVKEGNIEKKPLEIVLGKYQDSDCGMVIEEIDFASQVVLPDGKTLFFHDHGGMVNWLKDKNIKDSATIWVYTLDTNEWVDGKNAYYSLNETTPMGYGFGAYSADGEGRVDFTEMRDRMLRGENLTNPKTRALILGGE